MKLKDRVAFITGSSGGIGREIALAFAKEGAHMGLAARNMDKLNALAEEVRKLGRKAIVCRCDVLKNEEIVNAIRATVKALGSIDILVNSAGTFTLGEFQVMTDEQWHTILQTNLTAPFVAIREVLPSMIERKKGRIINIGSNSSKEGRPTAAVYAASKHGLLGLTKSLAAQVAPLGITANAICPGFVATEMLEKSKQLRIAASGKSREEVTEELLNRIPTKRFVDPKEIAPLAVYLASDESPSMTGQAINIVGGAIMY